MLQFDNVQLKKQPMLGLKLWKKLKSKYEVNLRLVPKNLYLLFSFFHICFYLHVHIEQFI